MWTRCCARYCDLWPRALTLALIFTLRTLTFTLPHPNQVARRLLGRQPGLQQLAEQLDPSTPPVQAEAWAGTARYLRSRTQATPEERPGRKPDMSEAAAAAFRAVLE